MFLWCFLSHIKWNLQSSEWYNSEMISAPIFWDSRSLPSLEINDIILRLKIGVLRSIRTSKTWKRVAIFKPSKLHQFIFNSSNLLSKWRGKASVYGSFLWTLYMGLGPGAFVLKDWAQIPPWSWLKLDFDPSDFNYLINSNL